MRVFIGAVFDDESITKLVETQNNVLKQTEGNKTKIENLHLTLFFIGDLDVVTAQILIKEFKQLSSLKLSIDTDSIITFKNGAVVLKFKNNSRLLEYRKNIQNILDKLNIHYDRKTFVPHVTLLRKSKNNIEEKLNFHCLINNVHLFSSLLTSSGPIYDILA